MCYPMECFPLILIFSHFILCFSFTFIPFTCLRSSTSEFIVSPSNIANLLIKDHFLYSIYTTTLSWSSIYIIWTVLPGAGSCCEVLVVRQLDTSCPWIMTPWGHILSIRRSGWTRRPPWLEGMCVFRGRTCRWGVKHYSHLLQSRRER